MRHSLWSSSFSGTTTLFTRIRRSETATRNARWFAEHPAVARAVESYLFRDPHRDFYRFARAALLTRTPRVKALLLDAFRHSKSFGHWPAWALLEGWGMEDTEVATVLRETLNSQPESIAAMGDLIPRIFPEGDEARCKLLRCLDAKEAEWPWHLLKARRMLQKSPSKNGLDLQRERGGKRVLHKSLVFWCKSAGSVRNYIHEATCRCLQPNLTDKQSHDSQLAELRHYCANRGWSEPEEIIDTISGTKNTRKGLDRLMAAVRRGEVVVVCFKLDRLGRSLSHLVQLVDEFGAHRVALVVPSQGIDTSAKNPMAEMQLGMMAVFAQFERAIIVERVNAGLAAAKRRGVRLGRPRRVNEHRDAVARLRSQGLTVGNCERAWHLEFECFQTDCGS